jgi:hypothetical protein
VTIASRQEQVSDHSECHANSTSFKEAQEIGKDASCLKQTFQPNRTAVELSPGKLQVEGEREDTGTGFTQNLPPSKDMARRSATRHGTAMSLG